MISWRRPSNQRLQEVAHEALSQSFSYPERGATRNHLPHGYRHDHWFEDLGPDEGARFERATAALLNWACQRAAGILVYPDGPPSEGKSLVLLVRLRPAGWVTATARIVYTVQEADRSGFAYGTLTGHPEQGEESFIISRGDGRVRFDITAFSRPRSPIARAAFPVTRTLQVGATRRYLAGLRAAAG